MENNTTIPKTSKAKYILYIIFTLYILMLLKIVLFKTASIIDIFKLDASIGIRSYNLIPFKTVTDFMAMKDTDFLWAFSNIIGNIGIFMPLGYLLPMLFKKVNKLSKVILISVILSIFFESMQYFCYLGALDIDDLILNTLGSICGYFIYYMLKKFLADEKKLQKISILLSILAFTVAFTIAKEQFGNLLGITKQEVTIKGDENIPKREPDLVGTYLSIKDNKLEMYKGHIDEKSKEKDFLKPLTLEINKDIKIYYMSSKEESKNKSTLNYKSLSKEELLKIEAYSSIKVWKDKTNPNLASVIVLSEKINLSDGVVISSDNLLEGSIEKITENGIVLNLSINQEFANGTSTSVTGIGENANLVNVEFENNTKFKLNLIKSNGDIIESKNCGKEALETECSVKLKGFKEGDNFIAEYIEIYKIK